MTALYAEKIDITVIVPVYQHWNLVEGLLAALSAQSLPQERWKLLLIDNGSDRVPDEITMPDFASILICLKPGSYAARNYGLEHVCGEVVVFTDADCRPSAGWLEAIWNEYKKRGECSLIAGAIDVVALHGGKPNRYELYDMALGLPQERYVKARGYAITANLAVPKGIFLRVGNFDSARLSGGDAEFCERAIKAGHQIFYLPTASVCHPARAQWEEIVQKARRIKGGQIKNGPLSRRLKFVLGTLIRPAITISRVLANHKLSIKEKLIVIMLSTKLWLYELLEIVLLLAGKQPERR